MSEWTHPAILGQAQPFKGLEANALEDLWRAGRRMAAVKSDRLFHQGDPARCLYVLLEGQVKMVQVTADGHEVIAGFIHPGEMFACVAAVGCKTYPASAVAVEPTQAIGWTQATWQDLLVRYPLIALNTMGTLGRRLQTSRERMVEMATETSEQRIAHAVLRLAADRGAPDGATSRALRVSRQDIASMTGTGVYTVSRTLQGWARRGFVELGRERVAVRDFAALDDIVKGAGGGT